MNYIENKINFERNYVKADFVKEEYILNYNLYFSQMKSISMEEIKSLCLEFFSSCEDTFYNEVYNLMLKNKINFIKDSNLYDGKTTFENGNINCTVVLKGNLYDLFILVHEITHYLTISTGIKELNIDEFMLFSEVFSFKMEDKLISFLKNKKIYISDLDKCIRIRKGVIYNIIKKLEIHKNDLLENVDYNFRYLISIMYKNKIICDLKDAIINFGNLSINKIIDFSI